MRYSGILRVGLLITVGIIVGIIIGTVFTFKYTNEIFRMEKKITGMTAFDYIAWESGEAYQWYRSGNSLIAHQFLLHSIEILEAADKYNEKYNVDFFPAPADLFITYFRLGKLIEAEGKMEEANQYFKKGIQFCKKYSEQEGNQRECTLKSIRDLVDKMDSSAKPEILSLSEVLFLDKSSIK